MKFFTQLLADAQPKANSLVAKTKAITNKVVQSPVVQKTGHGLYACTVSTVGVACVLATPAVTAVGSKLKKLVSDDKPVAKK